MPNPPPSSSAGASAAGTNPAASNSTITIPKPAIPPTSSVVLPVTPQATAQTVFSRPTTGQAPGAGQMPAAKPTPMVGQTPVSASPSPLPKSGASLPQPSVPQPAQSTQSAQPAAPQPTPPRPTPPTVPPPVVKPAVPAASVAPAGTTPSPISPPPKPAFAAPATATPALTPPPRPISPKPAPLKAEVKKPPFWLFAIIGVVLLGALGYFLFNTFSGGAKPTSVKTNPTSGGAAGSGATGKTQTSAKPTTIVYWGLWEPNEVMSGVIKEFEAKYPQYTIDYRKQSFKDYRERLQTAVASGNGPDVFRFHATWTPMLRDELGTMPTSVMNVANFEKTFYPVAAKQLEVNGKVVGVPLMYDGLALYYNKAMLKSANAEPPQTWAELKTLADALTVPANKSERDRAPLQRAGLAIGNATNVEHFSDILGLLILQNGGDPSTPNSNEVRDALLFYTNFIKDDKVWSDAMPSSTVAFARGDAAMMFAPSWRALDIKAMNPELDFGVAPVPKLGDKRISWASYWAEGVNAKSKNQEGAWTFINFMASAETQKKFFSAASQVRAFGEPYSRQDLASELNTDPVLGSILADAPTAQSWYLASFTHDNGLNDQLIKYYGDAVTATLAGKGMDEVLTTLNSGTIQVLRQYNVTSSQVGR